MRAEELCEATAQRLAELRIGSIIPADARGVLFVGGASPCLVVCRARLTDAAMRYMGTRLPVLLVRRERDIERVAQLLSFAAVERMPLVLSSLAMWRAIRA